MAVTVKKASDLPLRVITALIGGLAFVSVLYFGSVWGALAVSAIISLGMVWEFASMAMAEPLRRQKRKFLLFTALYFWVHYAAYGFYYGGPAIHSLFTGLIICTLAVCIYFLLSARRVGEAGLNPHAKEWLMALSALLYVICLPAFLPLIATLENGFHVVMLFFVLVWASDTGAYFAGRTFGKHPLYPLISPKKTWEGWLGGSWVSLLAALIYNHFSGLHLPWIPLLITGSVINVAAPLGDLCESLMKRAFQVKDSGSLLPGHGGFLDRFDGVILSLPVMYACLSALF